MTVPRVSVITPVYNGADHIAACIASVAASVNCGRIAVEHIIIDDGSTDGTVAALPPPMSYEGRLVCLVRLSDNSGKPAYARNRGIEAATGKYIFCLDHDDILLQNTLRYLASHLETTASEIAYGDFLRCDSAMVYKIGRDYYGWPHPNGRAALYSIFKGDHFYQHSFMFTKRLWHEVGGYDEAITYGEDLDLCIRFILAGHLPSHLPITTHIHRDHGKNLTAFYEHRSSVWFAERQAHYHKYMHQLSLHLTPDQISDIQDTLQITASTHLSGPLSQKAAATIVARKEMGSCNPRIRLESLNPTKKKIDELWAKEAEKRVEDIRTGKVETIPGEEVFKDIRDKFKL